MYLPTGPPLDWMLKVVLPVSGSRICFPRCGASAGDGGFDVAPEGPLLGTIGLGCSLGRLLCIFKKSQASSRAMTGAEGVRLRVFSIIPQVRIRRLWHGRFLVILIFFLLQSTRHTIVGTILLHGIAIRVRTPSSIETPLVSHDYLVMFQLFFVLGIPIHAFQQQPSLLQSHACCEGGHT